MIEDDVDDDVDNDLDDEVRYRYVDGVCWRTGWRTTMHPVLTFLDYFWISFHFLILLDFFTFLVIF